MNIHQLASATERSRERDGLRSELERLGVSVGQSEAVLQEATQDRDAARREVCLGEGMCPCQGFIQRRETLGYPDLFPHGFLPCSNI